MPFVLFIWGVGQVSAAPAAIGATLEPVLAAGGAWLALHQTLDPLQLTGAVLVVAAVLSLQLGEVGPAT